MSNTDLAILTNYQRDILKYLFIYFWGYGHMHVEYEETNNSSLMLGFSFHCMSLKSGLSSQS